MPITKSAKKALKRSRFLRARNLQFKIPMKKAIKAVRKGVAEGLKKDKISSLVVEAYSKIDRAAKRNIVHHKAAARLKSRLTSLVKNKLGINPFEKPVTKKTSKSSEKKTTQKKSTTKKASGGVKTTTKKTTTKKATSASAKKKQEDESK